MGISRKIKKATSYEVTIEEAFDAFIEEKKALNKSKSTITTYQGSFKRWYDYIKSKEMSLNIADVDDTYIFSFTQHCLGEDMQPSSLNHYVREIKAFLNWCMEKEMVKPFTIKQVRSQDKPTETYTEEEMSLLLARPHKNEPFAVWRTWAIINWIYATGNRASTVCEIKLGDLSYSRGEITIRKTKTGKAMNIPFSNALMAVMKEYTREWRAEASDNRYLFPNIGDEKLTVNALKHSISRYNTNRGVKRTSAHAIRHTFAKNWIRNAGNMFSLQRMLGHSTLEMTRRYVNLFVEDMKPNFSDYNPLDRHKKNFIRTQKITRNTD